MRLDVSGVKDTVVDAVEELYLKAATGSFMDPRQAAHNLVGLAQGSSLGQSFSQSVNMKPVLLTSSPLYKCLCSQ